MAQGSLLAINDRSDAQRRSRRRLLSVFDTHTALMRPANPSFEPPTDVYETEQEVIVRLEIAGVVLNNPTPPSDDASLSTNRQELAARCVPPILAEVAWQSQQFDTAVDWAGLVK